MHVSLPASHSALGAGGSAGAKGAARCRPLDEALRVALSGCECKPGQGVSRAELAYVFAVSTRTVARWEDHYHLPVQRQNARVLVYSVESVVMLCAAGHVMNRERAFEVNLVPDAILELAGRHGAEVGGRIAVEIKPVNPVLIATSDDERRLIRLWSDPTKREALRIIIQAMSV